MSESQRMLLKRALSLAGLIKNPARPNAHSACKNAGFDSAATDLRGKA